MNVKYKYISVIVIGLLFAVVGLVVSLYDGAKLVNDVKLAGYILPFLFVVLVLEITLRARKLEPRFDEDGHKIKQDLVVVSAGSQVAGTPDFCNGIDTVGHVFLPVVRAARGACARVNIHLSHRG